MSLTNMVIFRGDIHSTNIVKFSSNYECMGLFVLPYSESVGF